MKPSQDTYPVFEANQVLTNTHLNEAFSYVEEQERLTRANLIGIGIVCGLEIGLDQTAGAVSITRGCGVTSEGYLIVEPDDVTLDAFKPYTLPAELPYPPFLKADDSQYDLWELVPSNEPGGTLLSASPDFLKGKAVLLFLELKKEGLRNCSPSNCDDKGAAVTVTVRRLLITRTDLDSIIAAANQLPNATSTDLEGALTTGLNLPDLRLPRFDVPNTGPATSQQVLAAFQAIFVTDKVVTNTAAALSALYNAFQPLLQKKYPADPFAAFAATFGFLETVPATTTQVLFLQYYYDLFDDLLEAYYEFRRKGSELLCACCPPEGLFPRHLMLGLLFPNEVANPGIYRHHFIPSPAVGRCGDQSRELAQLFDRLVEMIARFTDEPPLPAPPPNVRGFVPARITPSRLGCAPLSQKAIPYYYQENGTPPLYQLWDPEKTRLNRANQNLSYRSDEYLPAAPPFVTNALRYDLEPYNFLRVEGHLGMNYQRVLATLLNLKSRFRLPIEIVALRTGAFNQNVPVDLSKESCHFQDLEALYDTLKGELFCFLCKEVQYFYSVPFQIGSNVAIPAKPLLPLLVSCAPDFLVQPQTLGRLFEDWLATQKGVIPDIDPNVIINFLNTQNVGQNNFILFYIIIYLSKLSDQLTQDLQQFDFAAFEKRYRDLVSVTEAVEREREEAAGNLEGTVNILRWEEIDDRLEDIIFRCRLDAFRALVEEYKRRIIEVKQKQFLSFFLRDHPGIQHKAGVPLGGTFIVVYHAAPPTLGPIFTGGLAGEVSGTKIFTASTEFSRSCASNLDNPALSEALSRIGANRNLAVDADIRLVLGTLTGKVPVFGTDLPLVSEAGGIIDAAVEDLADGTVIADFYLPYLCCSDCPPVQFVLPKTPPTFTVQIGCANSDNNAEITITPEGGLAPYSVKVDDQEYQPLEGALFLHAGQHTLVLKDSEGTESTPHPVTVAEQLVLGTPTFDCVGTTDQYALSFEITGGKAPYTANLGTVSGKIYTNDALPAGTETEIVITDSAGCTASGTFTHTCPDLTFTVQIGCTTDNGAPVTVIPAGGTAPYNVQIDDAPPQPVESPITLPAGTHSFTVSDKDGTVSPPQTVVVPAVLTVKETGFTCEGPERYRSIFTIEGGTQPYFANGQPVSGNTFTSDPVPNNQVVTVVVTDKNQCTSATEAQHTCVPQCTLPCGGISRRCAYRLWLQRPEGSEYKLYQQVSPVKFAFNGQDIPLPDTSTLLMFPVQALNGDFGNTLTAAIEKLNGVINEALVKALGETGKNRLTLSTTSVLAAPLPFSTLLIEHFVCDTFDLLFDFTFAQPDPPHKLTVRYSSNPDFEGMILVNHGFNNKETRVPAFACAQRNQCTNSGFENICKGPLPKPSFEAISQGNTMVFKGAVENANEVAVTAWVWDVLTAQPAEPFYQGQEVTTVLQRTSGQVRLTAITKEGCFGVNQRSIDIIL